MKRWRPLLAILAGFACVALAVNGALMAFGWLGPAAFAPTSNRGRGLASLAVVGVLLVAGGVVSLFGRRPNSN